MVTSSAVFFHPLLYGLLLEMLGERGESSSYHLDTIAECSCIQSVREGRMRSLAGEQGRRKLPLPLARGTESVRADAGKWKTMRN